MHVMTCLPSFRRTSKERRSSQSLSPHTSDALYVSAATVTLWTISPFRSLGPQMLSGSVALKRPDKDAGTLAFCGAPRVSCRNYSYIIHWPICINPIYKAPTASATPRKSDRERKRKERASWRTFSWRLLARFCCAQLNK